MFKLNTRVVALSFSSLLFCILGRISLLVAGNECIDALQGVPRGALSRLGLLLDGGAKIGQCNQCSIHSTSRLVPLKELSLYGKSDCNVGTRRAANIAGSMRLERQTVGKLRSQADDQLPRVKAIHIFKNMALLLKKRGRADGCQAYPLKF